MDKRVRRIAVPSFKLNQDDYILPKRVKLMGMTARPSQSGLNAGVNVNSINKMIRKENNYNLRNSSRSMKKEILAAQGTKTKQKFSERLREISPRKTNLPKLPGIISRSVSKSKSSDGYMSSIEEKKQTQALKQRNTFGNTNNNSFKKETREVAVQTEPVNHFNGISMEDNKQVDFQQTIDLLRKSIVGHVVKVKEDTFTINECSLSLIKENSDPIDTEILVIQPDKLISSSLLFLNSLYQNSGTQPQLINGDIANITNNISVLSYEPTENEDVITKCNTDKSLDIDKTQNSHTRKIFDFCKEVRVLLHKLPEDIVEASTNVQNMNEETVQKDGIENNKYSHLSNMEEIENIPQMLSVEISEGPEFKKTDLDPSNHTNSRKMNVKHSEFFTEILRKVQMLKNSKKKQDEEEKNIPEYDHYCNLCDLKFKYFQTLMYHKQQKHDDIRTISRCEICNDLYETSYYNYIHKEECLKSRKWEENCPKCSDKMDEKELFDHLLKNHHIVLKKDFYDCDMCTKKFITYKSLLYHNQTIHKLPPIEDLVFKIKCDNCGLLFDFDQYRKKHILECKNKNESEQDGNKSVDTTVKEEPSLFLNEDNVQTGSFGEKSVKGGESPDELFSKLKELLGNNDGPNDITIIDLDK